MEKRHHQSRCVFETMFANLFVRHRPATRCDNFFVGFEPLGQSGTLLISSDNSDLTKKSSGDTSQVRTNTARLHNRTAQQKRKHGHHVDTFPPRGRPYAHKSRDLIFSDAFTKKACHQRTVSASFEHFLFEKFVL